ncbi:MAG: hypothetical protein QMD01_08015 [Thermodesulfovibrionales bacterium]|nr:hypothetical protein [Thermodesulfovibrionales bacterium]
MKRLWEEAGHSNFVEESRYNEALKEQKELSDKLKKLDEELQEKNRLVESQQIKHKILEREYMALYNQHRKVSVA